MYKVSKTLQSKLCTEESSEKQKKILKVKKVKFQSDSFSKHFFFQETLFFQYFVMV